MANPKKVVKKEAPPSQYKSATCHLGNASAIANEWNVDGYEVKYCFAVVVNDEEGKAMQAVYMLASKRG